MKQTNKNEKLSLFHKKRALEMVFQIMHNNQKNQIVCIPLFLICSYVLIPGIAHA